MSAIEPGRCSDCHQPARRGPSGNWWHLRWLPHGECPANPEQPNPEQPAEFIPDQSDTP